jgi:hypothetical protein
MKNMLGAIPAPIMQPWAELQKDESGPASPPDEKSAQLNSHPACPEAVLVP